MPHARCISCGYDLAGLADDARCPECALEVRRSRSARSLFDADPRWLARVRVGIRCVAAGFYMFIAALVLLCLTLAASAIVGVVIQPIAWVSWLVALPGLLILVAPVVMVVGAWLATSQEPRVSELEHPFSARRRARITLPLLIPLLVLAPSALSTLATPTQRAALLLALLTASAVALEAIYSVVRGYLRRLPGEGRKAADPEVGVWIWLSLALAVASTLASLPMVAKLLKIPAAASGVGYAVAILALFGVLNDIEKAVRALRKSLATRPPAHVFPTPNPEHPPPPSGIKGERPPASSPTSSF